jgi:hypothetical protein
MKKHVILISFLLISFSLNAQTFQEREMNTEISEVTVFLEGAQLTRKKTITLAKGKYLLKFVQLSPFIDAKSIQVKSNAELSIHAVNHQHNYLEKSEKSKEQERVQNLLDVLEEQITLETVQLAIIKDELSFLEQNKAIGGKNEQINLSDLQQTFDFYSKKNSTLKLKEIDVNKKLQTLNNQKLDLENQLNQLSGKKEFPTGEILVKAEALEAMTFDIELSYLVSNAGWFPSYDIRAKNIREPVQLMYKANVRQDTKVDWKNVKLKLSSATPNISGVAPVLQTYYLNYHSSPPKYNALNKSVKGIVVDSNGDPLTGATVFVKGSTIGTVTDFNGMYSITIPSYGKELVIAFVGFNEQTLPITGETMNVVLEEADLQLEEIVVNGYSRNKSNAMLKGKVAGVATGKSEVSFRGITSYPVETRQQINQTSVDFEIAVPYTVLSDNKNYAVDIEMYELPAVYQYYAVPKVDKDAFLIAQIIDWEKFSLLDGEANVFFEETYIGKTILDLKSASDTLEISLGRDKQVSINREKIKDFTNRQLIGNKKEETIGWKTIVKNNKNVPIDIIILDQVPVSTLQEIEVGVINVSGAVLQNLTGEVKWSFELIPAAKKELELMYSIKYPKNRVLVIE